MANIKINPVMIDYAVSRLGGVGNDRALVADLMERFGLCKATAAKCLKKAYHEFASTSRAMIPFRRIRMRITLEKIAVDAISDSRKKGTTHGYTVAIKALQELSKIDGLYAPERVEVDDKRKRPEELTPEEQRKEIEQLINKREAAGLPPIDGLGVLEQEKDWQN